MQSKLNLKGLKDSLTKRTIREQVAQRIASIIQSGLLRSGDELPSERELATTLEVSRETVRGAIQMMAAVGMVEISQGSRTRVIGRTDFGGNIMPPEPELTAATARQLYEARLLVELEVVKLAVQRISPNEIKRLRKLVDAQHEMLEDPVGFQISDSQFHSLIYQSAENPLLTEVLDGFYSLGLQYRRKVLNADGAVRRSVGEHDHIVVGFEAGDVQLAAEMMRRHLSRIHETTLNVLQA